MPITFSCACGKTLRVKDELAGKRVKCPACGGVATAPAAETAFEVFEEPPPPPPRPVARPVARPAAMDEDDDEPRPAKAKKAESYDLEEADAKPAKKPPPKWKRKTDDEDEDEDRPRKKKKRRAESSGGVQWKAVGGGLVVMVLAAVWFGAVWMGGRIAIYPIILFAAAFFGMIGGFLGYGGDEGEE
jgi:hypothetical protein